MNNNLIERKIQKYTYKLSESTTRNKANFYQKKLKYYKNQVGGGIRKNQLGGAPKKYVSLKKSKDDKNSEKIEGDYTWNGKKLRLVRETVYYNYDDYARLEVGKNSIWRIKMDDGTRYYFVYMGTYDGPNIARTEESGPLLEEIKDMVTKLQSGGANFFSN